MIPREHLFGIILLRVSEDAPIEESEPSSPKAIGQHDVLIVSPGVLGRLVAEKWSECCEFKFIPANFSHLIVHKRTQPQYFQQHHLLQVLKKARTLGLCFFPKFDLETSVGSTMVRRASLQDLDDSTDRWAIVVRVFRKWNVYQKYAQ
ncbi:hypothetical protein K1719_016539 [Acacia pycnantha]|nr:hypothetical protein K1719_016539 [Acacia pycnantha]